MEMDGVLRYINDIVDILLVTYIIYRLLLLIRGTRAIQLLKGILVIISVWFLSTFFDLRTLRWLMSEAFTYGVLAILIIFQPELRRALEQLGRGGWFSRMGDEQEDKEVHYMVSEIVKAVQYMAKRRIGALLVIEQKTGLTDYIETGISLGAKVSSELLINIFIPNTPLHDGAVIIRKDKVMAAGCYLPLTENPLVDKELGTRHRAGIGLTEVSDALSVIVSEETGHVSLVINGRMHRDLDEEALFNRLRSEITPPEKTTTFWNRRGKENG